MSEQLSDNLISIGAYNYILHYLNNNFISDVSIRGQKYYDYYQQAMIDMAIPFKEAEKYIRDEETNIQTIAFNFYFEKAEGIYPLVDEDREFIQYKRLPQVAEIDSPTYLPTLQFVNFNLLKQFWENQEKNILEEKIIPQFIELNQQNETKIQDIQDFNINRIEEKERQNKIQIEQNQIEEKEGQNKVKINQQQQKNQKDQDKQNEIMIQDIQDFNINHTEEKKRQNKIQIEQNQIEEKEGQNKAKINQQQQKNQKDQDKITSSNQNQDQLKDAPFVKSSQEKNQQLFIDQLQNQYLFTYQEKTKEENQLIQYLLKEDQKFPPHFILGENSQFPINSQLKLREEINIENKTLYYQSYRNQYLYQGILVKKQGQYDLFNQINQYCLLDQISKEIAQQINYIPITEINELDKLKTSTLHQPDVDQYILNEKQLPPLLNQYDFNFDEEKINRKIFSNKKSLRYLNINLKLSTRKIKFHHRLIKCRKKKNYTTFIKNQQDLISIKNINDENLSSISNHLGKFEEKQLSQKNKSIFSHKNKDQRFTNQTNSIFSLSHHIIKHFECVIHKHQQILRKQNSFILKRKPYQKVRNKLTYQYLFNTRKKYLTKKNKYSIQRNLLPNPTLQKLIMYHQITSIIPHIPLAQVQCLQSYLEERRYNTDEMILLIEELRNSKQMLLLFLTILPYVNNPNIYNKEILIDINEGRQTSLEPILAEFTFKRETKIYSILPFKFQQWSDYINQNHKVKIHLSKDVVKILYPQQKNYEQYQAMQLHYNVFTDTQEARQLLSILDEIIRQKLFPTHFIKENFHQLLKITELDYICINEQYSIFKEKIWIPYYMTILPNEKKKIILRDGKSIINYMNFRISKNRSLMAEKQKGLKVDLQPDIKGYVDKIILEISNKTNQKKEISGFNLYIK